LADALATVLRTKLTVASIGEVTSRALLQRGITPGIVPTQSKMGALAQAVGEHFARLI
jgi:uroporphyrinogen-III synthase